MNELPHGLSRCLWLAREMPYPLISGDRVYSAGLSRALAQAGVSLTFVAHEGDGRERGPDDAPIEWLGIDGGTFNDKWTALTSPLPVTAGIHATQAFRSRLADLIEQDFDAIVIDQLGSGWALNQLLENRRARSGRRQPLIVYLAHNHERMVWGDMARTASGSFVRRVAVKNNAKKVGKLESQLVLGADLVLTITAEDARAFVADGARLQPSVLTPGYSGYQAQSRRITAQTERRVVMVGSFKWAIKEENLRQFLKIADPAFEKAGIRFDVIGKVPDRLRRDLEPHLKATVLHGFVQDVAPMFSRARMAVVPELIGGGFKLKLLDYLFGRMPVASIGAAAAGMPRDLREQMILADDLPQLVERIIDSIDQVDMLNTLQSKAYGFAEASYRWEDRGEQMKAAIEAAFVSLAEPASGTA